MKFHRFSLKIKPKLRIDELSMNLKGWIKIPGAWQPCLHVPGFHLVQQKAHTKSTAHRACTLFTRLSLPVHRPWLGHRWLVFISLGFLTHNNIVASPTSKEDREYGYGELAPADIGSSNVNDIETKANRTLDNRKISNSMRN